MATYYNSSNQRDIMPTLYLRDPGSASYQEQLLPGNMVYMNYASAGSYSDNMVGNLQLRQNCTDLPVPTAMLSQDSSAGASESTTSPQGILSNLVASRIGEHTYGNWRDGRNEMLFMQPTSALTNMQAIGGQINGADDLVRSSVTEDPQTGLHTQLGLLHGGHNFSLQQTHSSAVHGQGLSLTLSTQIPSAIPVPSFQYQHVNPDISLLGSHQSTSGDGGSCRGDDISRTKQSRNTEFPPPFSGGDNLLKEGGALDNLQSPSVLKPMHSNPALFGLSTLSSTIPNSKYLKAAQQLLDEVVNVRKALKQDSDKQHNFHVSSIGSKETDGGGSNGVTLPTTSSTSELSPSERQDLQNKMMKLLSMLDEVDKRYKQYYYQMQIVVSSFDVIAGCGAAKPYTALALQTISRHFRCLRDAISGQIRVTRISLGEQDTSANGKGSGISRLRFVDQQLRQQRALQQLGMIQQHAWRPQRGLPESSVSILRAWLFEHFLHPYPKDSDKIMLARQTGLTRSQVSNWFINARVRLWKPMVEEMYKEEIGDAEMDSNSSSENPTKAMDEIGPSEDREESQSMKSASEVCHMSQYTDSKSDIASDVEMSGTTAGTNYAKLKLRDQRPNADDCRFLQDALVHSDGSGRFITYQMAELGRFESNGGGGGVSLTLGLQHCDGGGLPVSGAEQNFVPVRGGDDDMYNSTSVGADTTVYECMDLGNQRHRFGSSHLLHDFVA
eukprot:TRINITY_DN845_c0_g1_i3.p1 TRINITY_DN845_c0_g1~~TRINITY_DN845_c0_g1_i3.p1  ORF type:complete len:725 (+),score=131.65 TRINITY_DN845_c0_g1_i3:751-2925(+)